MSHTFYCYESCRNSSTGGETGPAPTSTREKAAGYASQPPPSLDTTEFAQIQPSDKSLSEKRLRSFCWLLLVPIHITCTPSSPLYFCFFFLPQFCTNMALHSFFLGGKKKRHFVYFAFLHGSPPIALPNILPAFARGSYSGSHGLATTGKEPPSQLHPSAPSFSTVLLRGRSQELPKHRYIHTCWGKAKQTCWGRTEKQ